MALGPEALYPAGGYPGNDDDGKKMPNRAKIRTDMLNSPACKSARAFQWQGWRDRALLWRRRDQLSGGAAWLRLASRGAVLWARPKIGGYVQDQGGDVAELRRERQTGQYDTARI